MEASTTVRGRVLERQSEAKLVAGTTSKTTNLGHSSSRPAEHVEPPASASAAVLGGRGQRRQHKRPLELRLYQDYDDDDHDHDYNDGEEYEPREATYVVAGPDEAYTSSEMPKRINLGYNVGESWAVLRYHQAQEERGVAVDVRLDSEYAAMIRDMYARAAAANAAEAPQRRT